MGKVVEGFLCENLPKCKLHAAIVLLVTASPVWGQSGGIVHADFDSSDIVVSENSGSVEITGSITFSGTLNAGDFGISVISGSATQGVDYVNSGEITLTLVDNVFFFAVQITIVDDAVAEEAETVFFDFQDIDSSVIGANTPAQLRIIDNDSLAYIVVHSRGLIEAGDQLTLEILAVNVTEPVTYQWFKDGNPVMNGVGTTTSRLVINSVSEPDSGAYTLRIEDSSKALIEAGPFVVTVVEPGALPAASTPLLLATLLIAGLWRVCRWSILEGRA